MDEENEATTPNHGPCWVCGEIVEDSEPHNFYQYTFGTKDENGEYPIFAVHADEYPGDAFSLLLSPSEYLKIHEDEGGGYS